MRPKRRFEELLQERYEPEPKYFSFWQCYHIRGCDGSVTVCKNYDVGHSFKCKWTLYLKDLSPSSRLVEDTPTRKVVVHDDKIIAMTVFQLLRVEMPMISSGEIADERAPEKDLGGEYCTISECIASGQHLTDCDSDGFCNYCGEQDSEVEGPSADKQTLEAEPYGYWAIPEGISDLGRSAAKVIFDFAKAQNSLWTGGQKIFADPKEWLGAYGKTSQLIVIHEGTASDCFLSMDGVSEASDQFVRKHRSDLFEKLCCKLRGVGVFLEQCTRGYSAVYPYKWK